MRAGSGAAHRRARVDSPLTYIGKDPRDARSAPGRPDEDLAFRGMKVRPPSGREPDLQERRSDPSGAVEPGARIRSLWEAEFIRLGRPPRALSTRSIFACALARAGGSLR